MRTAVHHVKWLSLGVSPVGLPAGRQFQALDFTSNRLALSFQICKCRLFSGTGPVTRRMARSWRVLAGRETGAGVFDFRPKRSKA
jgi:hypothetical protein